MNLRCLIGLHAWKQSGPIQPYDTNPNTRGAYRVTDRTCQRCHRMQWWCPEFDDKFYGPCDDGYWTNRHPGL